MEAATGHVEIARQESVSSNLHTSRNPHAFVSRLPTETLQDIFTHYARDYHYRSMCPTKSVPSWVNVSYVCRHWRSVALGSPTLWTYLFIVSQRWTEVLLARSKQASLKIRVTVPPHKTIWLSCVEMAMNHIERIQELRLRLAASFIHRFLSRLSSRAPRLQSLDIMVDDPSVEWPSLLFDGDPPALRTLQLESCPVPLHSFRLNALTVLHLVDVPVRFQQNMEEFLAALSCMQDLKHLRLYNAFPRATGFLSSAVLKTFEKIDLTHLCHLEIDAPLSTTVALLSYIDIPLKTQIWLKCDSEPIPSLDHCTLLCSFLAQRYKDQAQSSPAILSLRIHFVERGAILAFSQRQRDITPVMQDDIPLYIELDYLMVDKDAIISDICSSMPLSNVQTLSVLRPTLSPVFWRRILRQLQDVRYITLFAGNMPDFSVLSLTDHTTHDSEDVQDHGGLASGDHQSHIFAPKLEELELDCITFSPYYNSDLPKPAITRSQLFETLSTRLLEGSPGRLTMIECNTSGSAMFDMVAVWGGSDGCYAIPDMDVEDSDSDLETDEEQEEEEEE